MRKRKKRTRRMRRTRRTAKTRKTQETTRAKTKIKTAKTKKKTSDVAAFMISHLLKPALVYIINRKVLPRPRRARKFDHSHERSPIGGLAQSGNKGLQERRQLPTGFCNRRWL